MSHTRLTSATFLGFALLALSGGLRAQPGPADVLVQLRGHADTVEAVAISPDGTSVATASYDRNVRLFDLATGNLLRTYGGEQGHKSQVLCVAFSAKGDLLATGGADNTLRVWDVPVGTPAKTFATSGAATRLLVAADGKTFAVAGADGVVKVFPNGEEKGAIELKGHAGAVTYLGLSGTTWITAGADRTIRFWDAAGKQTAARYTPEIVALATNANSPTAWLLTATGRVQAWAVPPPATVPPAVAVVGKNATAIAFDAALKKGQPVPGFAAKEWDTGGKPTALALSPDNARVVTVGPGVECVSWLTNTGAKERPLPAGGAATAAAFTKDGQRLAVAGVDGSVKLYTVGDGKLVGEFKASGSVAELAFHPTAPQLAGLVKNQAVAWNVAFKPGELPPEFGHALQSLPHPKGVASPVFLADGHLLTAGEDKLVRRFRIASDVPVKTLQHPNLVDCAAFDDTGERLATGCHDGILRIWDVPKATATKSINAHVVTTPQPLQNPIYAVAWTPDHKQVFTASFDKTIKLWDVASGNLVREFKPAPDPKPILPKKEEPKKDEKKDDKKDAKKDDKKDAKKDEKKEPPKKEEAKDEKGPFGHRDQVFSIALSKDGKLLASASSDKTVKLWDVATGKVVRDFPNPDLKPLFPDEPAPSHPGWVQAVRFTPDGQFLVSAGPAPKGKSYLAVWKVADGTRVFGAERDLGPIHALAITSDGTRLVLGTAAGKGKPEPEAVVIKLPGK